MRKFSLNSIMLTTMFIFFSCKKNNKINSMNRFEGNNDSNSISESNFHNNNSSNYICDNYISDPNNTLKYKEIDDALEKYYQRLGRNDYRQENGNGIFLNYIKKEQLDDIQLHSVCKQAKL
ncbi:MAG: hypothetical protein GY830_00780 [Bacteroidetes bacterium]|nr:hypothetical protein [Bacteroidota bacterium]